MTVYKMPLQETEPADGTVIIEWSGTMLARRLIEHEREQMMEQLLDLIQRFVDKSADEQDAAAIMEDIICGDRRLLTAIKGNELLGLAVLSVIVYQSGHKTLLISGLAGIRLKDWAEEIMTQIKTVAKNAKCDSITCSGPDGWMKKYLEVGWNSDPWTAVYRTYRLNLED